MTTPFSAIADRWDISRLVGAGWRLSGVHTASRHDRADPGAYCAC